MAQFDSVNIGIDLADDLPNMDYSISEKEKHRQRLQEKRRKKLRELGIANDDDDEENDTNQPEFEFGVPEEERKKENQQPRVWNMESHQEDSDFTDDVDDLLGIGLDNEISNDTVNPIRKTARNLNEDHLLHVRGLKSLKANVSKKLKPKLSHKDEYKNLTNMLVFYQLWGHNVFPKANFDDFITMCARVGDKSSRIKNMRRKWIEDEMKKNEEADVLFTTDLNKEEVTTQKNSLDEVQEENRDQTPDLSTENFFDFGDALSSQAKRKPIHNDLFFSDDDDVDDLYTVPKQRPAADTSNYREGISAVDSQVIPRKEINTGVLEKTFPPASTESISATTTKSEQQQKADEEFPDMDDFEDEYEAEMEAMREMEGL